MKRNDAEPIGKLIQKYLRQESLESPLNEQRLLDSWETVLGPTIMSYTRDLSVEECEGVSYFWNYRVANCATITQELESMIAKQLESTGNAALSTD